MVVGVRVCVGWLGVGGLVRARQVGLGGFPMRSLVCVMSIDVYGTCL